MTDATKGNVLLVDDDKFLVQMYGAKFTAAGYTVQVCLSGKDALDAIHAGFAPAVILFDITMPEMDGLTFLKTLSDAKLAPAALKIALTNQSDDAEKAKAGELGATGYIVKASVIPSEVVNTVSAELAKHKPAG
jgi:CheY-like chemotaxis protein